MHRRTPLITLAGLTLALVLAVAPRPASAYDDGDAYGAPIESHYEARRVERSRGYNDSYIFATTRMVNEMDVDPAFKVPLFPPAIVVDLVFLPAEVIAGLF
jgi:hypothetical protein